MSGKEGAARGCCESEGVDGRISCLGAMFLLRGTEGDTEEGGEDGGGRKRRRVEGGGVGGGGGATTMMVVVVVPTDVVEASTHLQRGCSEAEGEKVETTGVKFFRGRSCNVPHRLATLALRRCLLCCCSSQSFPSRCPSLPLRRRNNLLLGQPSRSCRSRSLFLSSQFSVTRANALFFA